MALLKALRSRLHPYDASEPYPTATDEARPLQGRPKTHVAV